MATINITVIGVEETARFFQNISNNIETSVVIPSTRKWAEGLRTEMIKNEHYRTGRMRSMTKVGTLQKGHYVIVDVPYAEKENSRPGIKRGRQGGGQGTQHRFVEPSMKAVEEPQFESFLANLVNFIVRA